MYKILIIGMSPVLAGTETFIMNYYRHLDTQKFHVDFIKRTKEPIVFEDEILQKGSNIYYLPRKGKTPYTYQKYKKAVRFFFEEHGRDYDAIWHNAMSIPNIDLLNYAKKYGIKERIIHSHNSQWRGNAARFVLHQRNKRRIKKVATQFFACSDLAAQYMYGSDFSEKVRIIQNAIDKDNFAFSAPERDELRAQLGWSHKKIIGNVGRLDIQKNQPFLIDVFHAALQLDDSLRLVIIGQVAGAHSTVEKIKKKISDYGIEDRVLLAGSQTDMKKWLSAFDLFILPSLSEGLPLSAVEAQANGLPVLVSDTVTKELKILDSTAYLSLDAGIRVWAQKIISMLTMERSQQETITHCFAEKRFDITKQVKDVESILLGEKFE
ncbi:glycosyltransferase family 1 protein [Streptococcus pantholopis]|uniref:Glycosyltransferase n=1 Tax=Streptococcus pantholopis TaxID=1811193 RepID=A0A172Q7J2_9STRE|nr:glycosyltransferase family 1 protein [Streptococcus pantholopis]AND79459.1 glycosyltransferase [Streptococcus pantholopis]